MSLVNLIMLSFPRPLVATHCELVPNSAALRLSKLLEPGLPLGYIIACRVADDWWYLA